MPWWVPLIFLAAEGMQLISYLLPLPPHLYGLYPQTVSKSEAFLPRLTSEGALVIAIRRMMNTAWDGVTGAVTGPSARQLHTLALFFLRTFPHNQTVAFCSGWFSPQYLIYFQICC